MKNKYLITLTPIGNYFFGGELTFGDLNIELAKKENERKINYLVKGNQFPQQTTLLGMLRYELLRKKGWLSPLHRSIDAIKLAGTKGFDSKSSDSFGIIDKLFPIFISQGNKALIPHKHLRQSENDVGKEQLKYIHIPILEGNGSCLTNYDAKHSIDDEYAQMTGLSEIVAEKIFDTATQIGIKKNYSGNTEENAFFKQTSYRLNKGFSFAFFAQFNQKPEFECGVIFMGGDQSLFKFEISDPIEKTLFDEIDEQNQKIIEESNEIDYFEIVLISDCKVSKEVFDHCLHSVNDIRDFRHIIVTDKTTGFAQMNKPDGFSKSANKLELLTRNSILFVKGKENLKKVAEIIDSEKAFKNIGYNFFKIIKKQI